MNVLEGSDGEIEIRPGQIEAETRLPVSGGGIAPAKKHEHPKPKQPIPMLRLHIKSETPPTAPSADPLATVAVTSTGVFSGEIAQMPYDRLKGHTLVSILQIANDHFQILISFTFLGWTSLRLPNWPLGNERA
jgi:hypothetical protein